MTDVKPAPNFPTGISLTAIEAIVNKEPEQAIFHIGQIQSGKLNIERQIRKSVKFIKYGNNLLAICNPVENGKLPRDLIDVSYHGKCYTITEHRSGGGYQWYGAEWREIPVEKRGVEKKAAYDTDINEFINDGSYKKLNDLSINLENEYGYNRTMADVMKDMNLAQRKEIAKYGLSIDEKVIILTPYIKMVNKALEGITTFSLTEIEDEGIVSVTYKSPTNKININKNDINAFANLLYIIDQIHKQVQKVISKARIDVRANQYIKLCNLWETEISKLK